MNSGRMKSISAVGRCLSGLPDEHPTLRMPIGEPLTVREARRALQHKDIREATVLCRIIFGQEEVALPVTKKALLDALPSNDEAGDETVELYLGIDNQSIEQR